MLQIKHFSNPWLIFISCGADCWAILWLPTWIMLLPCGADISFTIRYTTIPFSDVLNVFAFVYDDQSRVYYPSWHQYLPKIKCEYCQKEKERDYIVLGHSLDPFSKQRHCTFDSFSQLCLKLECIFILNEFKILIIFFDMKENLS